MDDTLTLRVGSLGDLMEGWFEDRVEPYPESALGWLAGVLEHLIARFHVPAPYVYPTPQGFVRAGWVTARWDVIADFDITSHAVAVFAREVATHEIRERRLELERPGAESQFGRFIAGHMK